MVRRHGWQLPAHAFQVVAITIFFLLAVAYYVFLAPFLWIRALEFAALAVYSPLAVAVFLLYIRSSAIDPADPGVFARQPLSKHGLDGSFSETSESRADGMYPMSPGLLTPSRSTSRMASDGIMERKVPYFGEPRLGWQKKKSRISLLAICGLFCGWVVKDDNCRDDLKLQQPVVEEDVLFCTLCNAEVRKFSKHCRSCDKCVDGFDHHCRWLNNCVGRKNYNTFVSLMATSLSLLILEWGSGMAVLVRCFVDKNGVEHQIIDKLGNSFSRPPFATVVAICTLVSLLASIPLGELFFFHIILIRKGITTYEYVVAMRQQNEPQMFTAGEGEMQSVPTSPSSSTATGLSGTSSVGLQYSRGAWCTPPRVFVEHQDEVVPHLNPGRAPSTIDPDAEAGKGKIGDRGKKPTVRISAWKLVNLNVDDVNRAAAKARENSSVLRQIGPAMGTESDPSSSGLSTDYMKGKQRFRKDHYPRFMKAGPPVSTSRNDPSLQMEPAEEMTQRRSSFSSLSHTMTDSTSMSPLPAERVHGLSFPVNEGHRSATISRSREAIIPVSVGASYIRNDIPPYHANVLSHSSAGFSQAWSGPAPSSDGYEASSGESADDGAYPWINQFPDRERDLLHDSISLSANDEKSSGLYGDSPVTVSRVQGLRETSHTLSYTSARRNPWPEGSVSSSFLSDDNIAPSDYAHGNFPPSQRSVSSAHDTPPNLPRSSPLALQNNLLYSGTSIFYGGPIVEPPSLTMEEVMQKPPSKPPQTAPKPPLPQPSVPPAENSRPPPRSAVKLQSPVFAPRTMVSLTPLNPGSSLST